jgi:hypothetical protein
VGPGQRPPEGVIRYRLGDVLATRRARAAAAVGAVTSLAPVVFAVVLLTRLGWQPATPFWAVAAVLVALVVVRAAVGYGAARRRLRAMVVLLTDDDIRVETARDTYAIARTRAARIVEIDGALGGLRVESAPDPDGGGVSVVHVPRGGEAFGELRRHLARWGPIERRGRRGPLVRLAVGAVVVAGIFFVPFLLDDFVARSRIAAAGLVLGMWLVMRVVIGRR